MPADPVRRIVNVSGTLAALAVLARESECLAGVHGWGLATLLDALARELDEAVEPLLRAA